jgi:3-hydroxyisobutyrate dehydrogenase-like beta-hydroxyacid dehydrogenase
MMRVAIVGLGQIGRGAAISLARAGGFDLVGYDAAPETLARAVAVLAPAGSVAEAAAGADIVLVAVFDDAQVRDVLAGPGGILAASPPVRAVVVLSTVTAGTIAWAAAEAAAHGVELVDCGVSGGKAIEQGLIVAMIGGSDAAVAAVRPVVEGFATPVVHTGPLGTGMAAKLARNMIVYGCWYVVSEAARLADAAGVSLDSLVEISDAADRQSGGPTAMLRRGRSGDPEKVALWHRIPEYAHKDLRAALELAGALGVELPGAELVEARFDATHDVGRPPEAQGTVSA